MTSGRVFQTCYSPQAAAAHLWIPLLMASALGLGGLILNVLPMTAISAMFTLLALRNWAYSTPSRVILQMTERGVDIDGLGHLEWAKVQRATVLEIPGLRLTPRILRIELNAPNSDALLPKPSFDRPAWQRKLGKLVGANTIAFSLNGMLDPSSDIIDAFNYFLGDRLVRMSPRAGNDNRA